VCHPAGLPPPPPAQPAQPAQPPQPHLPGAMATALPQQTHCCLRWGISSCLAAAAQCSTCLEAQAAQKGNHATVVLLHILWTLFTYQIDSHWADGIMYTMLLVTCSCLLMSSAPHVSTWTMPPVWSSSALHWGPRTCRTPSCHST
jgi:hypothetical protein